MGEKPLYWARDDAGRVLVASEIKSLLASGLLRPRLDRAAVDAYLALLYVPPDRTIYENVHTLPPGGAMAWEGGNLRQWRYWEPAYSTLGHIDPREAVAEVRRLVDRAVERQMVADVPVGAFLSGGLDSSTIVALMTRHTARPVKTFSVGFGDLINELPFAREVAGTYKTEHYELQMDIDVAEAARRMASVYDEPFADSSNIPTYLMSEFAARHVKVALAGDGGDELFGGYDWYLPLLHGPVDSPGAALALRRVRALVWRAVSKAGLPAAARRDAAVLSRRGGELRRRHADLWDRHLANSTFLYRGRSAARRSGAGWRRLMRPTPSAPRTPPAAACAGWTAPSTSTSAATSPATYWSRSTAPRWPMGWSPAHRSWTPNSCSTCCRCRGSCGSRTTR